MPLRAPKAGVYATPHGSYDTKRRTFSGRGPAPVGSRKIKAPTAATVPTVTTSHGKITAQHFPSPRAASRAVRHQRSSRARVEAIERLLRPKTPQPLPKPPRGRRTPPSVSPGTSELVSLSKPPPSVKPATFQGLKTAGTPTLQELRRASSVGGLRQNRKGYVTTPAVRKVAGTLHRLESKAAANGSSLPGLGPPESRVARKVLSQGRGATKKEKLAAAETGLVESGFKNLPGGTSDSEGWRQERASLYPNPRNVKAGAQRFFSEAREQSGATAGELAANVQRPAEQYRGRYDERKPEANAIVKAFEKGGLKPVQQRKLAQTQILARKLGLKVSGASKVVSVPGKGRYVFPFPASKGWTWSRTDQGTDFGYGASEGAPIRALGDATVVSIGAPGWPGGGGVLLKLSRAKGLPSPYVAVNEGIVPMVKAGQRVQKGQTIGTGAMTGSIEIFFSDSSGVPLSHAEYTEGMVTKYGQAMTNFLHMVESGKTRIPVGILQVPGTVVPSGGGTVVSPSGVAEATLVSSRAPSRPRLTQVQKAHRILKKLEQVGAGLSEKPSEGSESKASVLRDLERTYGKKAA